MKEICIYIFSSILPLYASILTQRHCFESVWGPRTLWLNMMSLHGNAFSISGPLLGVHRWPIALTKVQWCRALVLLCSHPEQAIEEIIELVVLWDVMTLMLCYIDHPRVGVLRRRYLGKRRRKGAVRRRKGSKMTPTTGTEYRKDLGPVSI